MKAPVRMLLAQHLATHYQHQMAEGETLDDALNPAFWVHVAQYFKPGFRVTIMAHDYTWTAELMCRGVADKSVKMGLVSQATFGTKESILDDASPLIVKWAGPHAKWRVERASDSEVVKAGFDIKEDAEAWAAAHVSDMAA